VISRDKEYGAMSESLITIISENLEKEIEYFVSGSSWIPGTVQYGEGLPTTSYAVDIPKLSHSVILTSE
jgi:hypothetical protein